MSQKRIKRLRKETKQKLFQSKASIEGLRSIITKYWKFLVLLLLSTTLVYVNSLWGDFVSDDYATILNNPEISTKWAGGAQGSNKFNLVLITNHLLAVFFGVKSPIPFHVYNLFIYLLCLVTGFVFLYLLFGERISKLAIVLFAFHPIHVESVSWVSGKPYLYNSLFQFVAYISLIMISYGRKKYYWSLFVSLILSFLSAKIQFLAFVFVGPLVLFYLAYEKKCGMTTNIFWKGLGIVVSLIPILLLILWSSIKKRIFEVNGGYVGASESMFYSPFFQYPTLIAKYLQLLWLPLDLTLYHTMYIFPLWLYWAILLVYLAIVFYSISKNKDIFFGLVFIFFATAPSMAPVKVSWLTAERYIFMGTLGWCLFLSILWVRYLDNFKILKWSIVIFVIGLFGVRVLLRNNDWQTNHKLWVNTVQVSPNSHNAWNNIGDDYDKLADYANAIKGFSQSIVMKPDYADAYHNRANIYYKIGYLDLAERGYLDAISINKYLFQSYVSLIQVNLSQGRLDKALDHANLAVNNNPNDFQSRYIRAYILKENGRIEEAKNDLKNCIQLNPNFPQARQLLTELGG